MQEIDSVAKSVSNYAIKTKEKWRSDSKKIVFSYFLTSFYSLFTLGILLSNISPTSSPFNYFVMTIGITSIASSVGYCLYWLTVFSIYILNFSVLLKLEEKLVDYETASEYVDIDEFSEKVSYKNDNSTVDRLKVRAYFITINLQTILDNFMKDYTFDDYFRG